MGTNTFSSSRPVLIGRESEQRTLHDAVTNLTNGEGALLLIGGEAGIGKTALVDDFLPNAHRMGATVLCGACYDVDSPSPYAPWVETLSPPVRADVDGPPAPAWFDADEADVIRDRSTIFQTVRKRLLDAAARQPLVIVLEDLHWADRETLDLLRYVSRHISQVPILIIGTYRDDETDITRPFHFLVPQLVREARAVRIELRRFTVDLIRQLVDQRYDLHLDDHERLVRYLERRTEGNPFFLVELLRSLEMADVLAPGQIGWRLASLAEIRVPMLVRQVIDRRLLRLDNAALAALQIAATLGHEVQLEHWRSCAELDEAELARVVSAALDTHLMEQSPEASRLRFRHALIRESIYDSVPLPLRQAQHRRIATILAETGRVEPAIVAAHFRRAADDRAASWLLRAAQDARRLYAPYAVIQHIDAALELAGTLTSSEYMEALRLRGWAHEISGEFDAAHHDLLQALERARESADGYAEWETLIHLAELWASLNYERTGEYVVEALARAGQMEDDSLRAYSLNRLGNWHLNAERPTEARRDHHQALEIFQCINDQAGIAATYDLLGITCYLGSDLIEGTTFYQRAVELFRSLENRQGLSSSLANLSMRGVAYQTDTMVQSRTTLRECIESGTQALAAAREMNWRAGETYARLGLVSVYGSHGEYQAALDEADLSISLAEEIGHRQWLTAACCNAGMLYLDLLEPHKALRHLQRARAISEETHSWNWIRCASGKLALAHLLGGADNDAASEIWTTNPAYERPPATLGERLVWRAWIELEIVRGNADAALDLIDRMLASTPHARAERPPVRLAMLRGAALNMAGRFKEAERWLTTARSIASEQGARSSLWRIHRDLGIAQRKRGHRLAASEAFAEARRFISEISGTIEDPDEASRFQQRALSQLPESWSPTPLQTSRGSWGGLTRRQREVAALVATGSSNREIAEHLSISERTVESHAAAILATLGLSTRAQVAAWAVEHGLVDHSR